MAGATLGHDAETGEPVVIDDLERQRGLYVIGTTGTGKTTLLESLVLQDIQAGLGVCVLDPHGDLVTRVLSQIPDERQPDVVLLDPRDVDFPFGLNPYWCGHPEDAEIVGRQAAQVSDMFEKLWGSQGSEGTSWGPRVAQFIRNTAFTLLANPGLTMAEIPALLTDASFRTKYVKDLANAQVRLFWENYDRLRSVERQLDRAESTLNKLDEFLTQPIVANIVGQSVPTVDFRGFMDDGKIVLVPLGLGRLGEPVVALLGSLIILQLLNAALSRENALVRRQFNLYADEYQRFATPAFATLLTEARKYGVATTIAHQVRAQLDSKTRAAALNAGNLVVFAVHGEDGEELAKQFDRQPPPPVQDSERPNRSIHQDPLNHLVRQGHNRPHVRALVTKYITPLINKRDNLKPNDAASYVLHPESPELNAPPEADPVALDLSIYTDKGIYYTQVTSLREGLNLLNGYLVDVMEHRLEPQSSDAVERLALVAFRLRGVLGIANDSRFVVPRWSNEPSYWTQDPVHKETKNALALVTFSMGATFEQRTTEYGTVADNYDTFLAMRALYLCESALTAEVNAKDIEERLAMVTPRARLEAKHLVEFLLAMSQLGTYLQEEPILIDNGQYVSVLERPRSYSDVEAEIASRLVNQPQFHAHCRITVAGFPREYHIKTRNFLLLDEAHSSRSAEAITAISRSLYARPRQEVEREIKNRQFSPEAGTREESDTRSTRFAPIPEDNDTRSTPVPPSTTGRKSLFCYQCGLELSVSANFCTACGMETDAELRRSEH